MKVKNIALVNLKGETLRHSSNPPGFPAQENDPPILVSDVLANVVLTPARDMTPKKAAERVKLGRLLIAVGPGEEIDIPDALVADLDKDCASTQAVLVAGQIHELLK